MREYVCADCGYVGDYDDGFSLGCCPACGCDDIYVVEREAEQSDQDFIDFWHECGFEVDGV